MQKICIILGTRPEIIKLFPLIEELRRRRLNFFIIHTNQHYAKNLDLVFFKEFGLAPPTYNLKIGSRSHAQSTARMLIGIEKIIDKEKPGSVIVLGDTNTALAGALTAVKMNIKVVHIEAGARSHFKDMPEEINRTLIDHISDYLFVTTSREKTILINEGIPSKTIFVTGNTIVDVVCQFSDAKNTSSVLSTLALRKNNYFLATIHREENVDQRDRLSGILEGLRRVHRLYHLPIIWPIHPRAEKRLKEFKLSIPSGVKLISPQSYIPFVRLLSKARLVFTDSGGVTEESCILRVPDVVVRDNFEWPEIISAHAAILVGTVPEKIVNGAKKMLSHPLSWPSPFGKKGVAKRIVKILEKLV